MLREVSHENINPTPYRKGHTLKGIGISLGISTNLEAVTAQYVDVRLDRKKIVLDTYHNALHPKKTEQGQGKTDAPKKKSSEQEL